MKTPIKNLNDALITKLKALYDIETQLVKALPKMAKKATDKQLREAFERHLSETEIHVQRLEECFELIEVKPGKIQADAIRGLIADAEWIIKEKPLPETLDAMLIAAASYIEHYEIAGYVTASRWSRTLDYAQVTELLEKTLDEEGNAADTLIDLADGGIDDRAMGNIAVDFGEPGEVPLEPLEEDMGE